MKKYLVIGNPIEHSLSPKLHNYWFEKNNIDANYDRRKIDKSEIEETINEIKNNISNGIYNGIDYTFNQIRNIDTYTPQDVKNGTIKHEIKDRLNVISKLFTYLQYAIITSIVLLFIHILLVIWKGKTSMLSGFITVLIPFICLLIMTIFYL